MVSVASLIDLHYLVAKGRLAADVAQEVWAVTRDPTSNIVAMPVTPAIAERFRQQGVDDLSDPWDRLIVCTAIELGLPLVTVDAAITSLGQRGVVDVIW